MYWTSTFSSAFPNPLFHSTFSQLHGNTHAVSAGHIYNLNRSHVQVFREYWLMLNSRISVDIAETLHVLFQAGPAVMLGLVDPVPSLLVMLNQMCWTSTLNVLCFLILFQSLRILPCLGLVYISDTANVFLLFWELLQWFLLYSFFIPSCSHFFQNNSYYLFPPIFIFPAHYYPEPLTSCSHWN